MQSSPDIPSQTQAFQILTSFNQLRMLVAPILRVIFKRLDRNLLFGSERRRLLLFLLCQLLLVDLKWKRDAHEATLGLENIRQDDFFNRWSLFLFFLEALPDDFLEVPLHVVWHLRKFLV